MTNMQLI